MASLLELADIAFCIGVSGPEQSQKAYLLHLEDPMCVLTRPCKTSGEFSVGKWYKKQQQQSKLYKPVDDVVKTTLVRQINPNCNKTTIELVLPVFFPPDLAQVKGRQFGQMPSLKNANLLAVPICPLFGPEGVECIPPIKWSDNVPYPAHPSELFALKVNLSYTTASLPEWMPQNVGSGQMKPWNYQEYPIVQQHCVGSCQRGILIDMVTRTMPSQKNMQFGLILNREAELAVALFEEGRQISIGHYLHYWPIKLDIYSFPVVIALDCSRQCSQVDDRHSDLLALRKSQAGDKFEFALANLVEPSSSFSSSSSSQSIHSYTVPWLGKLMDPFGLVQDQINKEKPDSSSIRVVAKPLWNLAKASVAWAIDGIVESEGSGDGGHFQTNKHEAISNSGASHPSNGGFTRGIFSAISAGSQQPLATISGSSSKLVDSIDGQPLLPTIAAFMTVRQRDNSPVFLFWDVDRRKFVRKCYAQFDMRTRSYKLDSKHELGGWYELRYLDDRFKQDQLIVHDYALTEKRAFTRVRDGICAQFSTNRDDQFVKVWHAKYPCPEKNNFAMDKDWWPWLCRSCFPSLLDLASAPTPIAGMRADGPNMTASMENLARRMQHPFALDGAAHSDDWGEEDKSSPDVSGSPGPSRPSRPEQAAASNVGQKNMKKQLAAMLAVREECNGDSVFLLFDEGTGKFTQRVYADPPARIGGNPVAGGWYRIESSNSKLNFSSLKNGQRITHLSVEPAKSAVETRVVNGLAQFNTEPELKFLTVWHKGDTGHHPYKYSYSRWWPSHCTTCYPYPTDIGPTISIAPANAANRTPRTRAGNAANVDMPHMPHARGPPIPVCNSFRRAQSQVRKGTEDGDSELATPKGNGQNSNTGSSSNNNNSVSESVFVVQKKGEPHQKLGTDSTNGGGGEVPSFAAKANAVALGELTGGFGSARFRRYQQQQRGPTKPDAVANREQAAHSDSSSSTLTPTKASCMPGPLQ